LLLGTKKGQRDAQRTSSLLGNKSTDKKIELEQEKQKKISDPAAAHHKDKWTKFEPHGKQNLYSIKTTRFKIQSVHGVHRHPSLFSLKLKLANFNSRN
jgi:hypothetical protein